jgi:hypothetical protein
MPGGPQENADALAVVVQMLLPADRESTAHQNNYHLFAIQKIPAGAMQKIMENLLPLYQKNYQAVKMHLLQIQKLSIGLGCFRHFVSNSTMNNATAFFLTSDRICWYKWAHLNSLIRCSCFSSL